MGGNEITNEMAQELIETVKLNGKPSEIKFKTVFRKERDLKGILKDSNLDYILDWIEKYDIHFHFTEYNIWFDFTNDLYEMLPGESISDEKEMLKKLVFMHSKEIANLLDEIKYPIDCENILLEKMTEIFDFNKLLRIRNVKKISLDELCLCYERDIIGRLKKKMEAAMKEPIGNKYGMEQGVLTEDFTIAYLLPTIIFKNSLHIFDNEDEIKNKLKDHMVFIGKEQLLNYKFVNVTENKQLISKEIKAVYICDWIIRILQQMVQYVRENGEEELYAYLRYMGIKEKNRFIRLCRIIRKSKELNPLSFCFCDIESVPYRFNWFINFEETLINAQLYHFSKDK